MDSQKNLEWLARNVFAFIVVPFFGYLGYYAEVRPSIISLHGGYWTGFIDCALLLLSLLVIILFIYSKLQTLTKNN